MNEYVTEDPGIDDIHLLVLRKPMVPGDKYEIRISKHQTNPKSEYLNSKYVPNPNVPVPNFPFRV
jgi:hypothetical protein